LFEMDALRRRKILAAAVEMSERSGYN